MVGKITLNDRVFTNATNFDDGVNNWSVSMFGSRHKTAICYGVVKKISGNIASVLWELDNEEMPINIGLLQKAKGESEISSKPGFVDSLSRGRGQMVGWLKTKIVVGKDGEVAAWVKSKQVPGLLLTRNRKF